MAKHLKLQYTESQKAFLVGIVSSVNHLKLSWALNQALGLQLAVKDKIILPHSKTGQNAEYSLFQYENEDSLLKYSLISNKASGIHFFEELKNIDYFLVIKTEPDIPVKDSILQTLKSIPEIATFLIIHPETIKRKERLELL